jgi:ribosomal protein RSM22 (predicted rRNA methylase)
MLRSSLVARVWRPPVRARGTKMHGAMLVGDTASPAVPEREVDGGDELPIDTLAFLEDVQTHLRAGMVRPRTPQLEHVKIGVIALPDALQAALSKVVHSVPRGRLIQEAAALSDALRARTRASFKQPVPRSTGVTGVTAPAAAAARSRTDNDDDNDNDNDTDNDTAARRSSVVPAQSAVAPVIVYDRIKAMAYAAFRLPGVFACVSRVLAELRLRRPDFVPARVLDYGCGPGTGMLAIQHVWPDQMKAASAIEPSAGMEWIAQQLLGDELGKRVLFNRYQVDAAAGTARDAPSGTYDLVVVSYVLSELATPVARRKLIRSLWQRVRPGGFVVVIEPGTPIGAGTVREARHVLLGVGEHAPEHGGTPVEGRATTVAPCPHDGACPLDLTTTWCHFGQRVRRSALLRAAKQGINNFEDEKFSYAILERMTPEAEAAAVKAAQAATEKRGPGRPKKVDVFARLLTPPRKRSGHVLFRGCFSDGTVSGVIVPRSAGADLYTSARKSGWGDVVRNLAACRRDDQLMRSLLPEVPTKPEDDIDAARARSRAAAAPKQARAEPFDEADNDEFVRRATRR